VNGVNVEKKEEPPYVIGFALPFGADVGAERAHIVTTYFSKVLNHRVEPRLFDYDQLGDAMGAGSIDFAFMTPIAYVKAAQLAPVKLIRQAEHNGALSYRSVLFVRASSGITSIADAQHKRVAWVEAGSASGRLFPMFGLITQGIDPNTYFSEQLSLADHARVCKAVYEGKADIGASFTNSNTMEGRVDGCYRALEDRISDLRIITLSAPIPNDVFVARANEPAELVATMARELDRMMGLSGGEAVLREGFQSEGFYSVSDDAFDPVRQVVGVPIPFRQTPGAAPTVVATTQFGAVPAVPAPTAGSAPVPVAPVPATPLPVGQALAVAQSPQPVQVPPVAPVTPSAVQTAPAAPAPPSPAVATTTPGPNDVGAHAPNRRIHRHPTQEVDLQDGFRIGG
jgi:phosphate/phosphite/phosphonate ABC transporter binding protein